MLCYLVLYDPVAQISCTQNPAGTWSYLYATDSTFAQLAPMTLKDQLWSGNISGTIFPFIGTCASGQQELTFHAHYGGQVPVLRWTSPATYSEPIVVLGAFTAGDIGKPNVAIRFKSVTVWSAIDAGAFTLTLFGAAAGDTIDFVVYGETAYGSTRLQASISVPDTQSHTVSAGQQVRTCLILPLNADGGPAIATTAKFTDFQLQSVAYGSVSGIVPADGQCYPQLTFYYTSPSDCQGYARGPFSIAARLSAALGSAPLSTAWAMTVNAGTYWCIHMICWLFLIGSSFPYALLRCS